MTKQSKRMKSIAEKVGAAGSVALNDALKTLADLSSVKFTESVDVSVNLGVDPRKSDQVVRGSVVLPAGTGKTVKVAVFAEGAAADAAKEAGADIVGFEDLAEIVKKGELDVDVVVATPAAMKLVGRLGQILGPKGLMPNPKDGTVSQDVAAAVNSAKSGQVRFRTDKNGIVHSSIGKITFKADDLKANLRSFIQALNKLKPTTMKGVYLKKVSLSTTMGPGIAVDISSIDA